MSMEPNNGELSFAQKAKIVGALALAALLFMVVVGGTVSYQRQAKIEAAELAKTQLANVEAMKTVFPDYKNTEQFKERAKMAMTKISVEDLPATIEAGLDETVSPNPACETHPDGWWYVSKNDVLVADLFSNNGWSVSSGGAVSIPAGAEYGKYSVAYASSELCTTEGGAPDDGYLTYSYVFKITPPCPTVTLTASPRS